MLALLPLSAVTLGCHESLGPDDVAGAYVLELVGDAPLPAEVFRDGSGIVRVVADTLRLRENGRGTLVSVRVIDPTASAPTVPTPSRLETALTFRVVDERIEMAFVCPPNASCVAGPHLIARRRAQGLVVEAPSLADEPLSYRQLDPLHR
jgi:hypothetical protein